MSLRLSPARAAVASLLLSTFALAACGGGSDDPPATPAPTATSVLPTSGTTGGGTAVVLTGTNFVTGATVTVGGTAATGVTVTPPTTINFTTPAHAAGAVDVVVTNPDAQSATLAGGFTYLAPVDQVWVVPDAAATLSAAQRTAFTDGNLYVNAHTTANGAGEIRGQLDLAGTVKLASLDGAQETPAPITTSAFGAGVLEATIANRDGRIDRRVLKLVRLAASFATACPFCADMNAHRHREAGVTDEELAALREQRDPGTVASFTDLERLAIRYARLASQTPLRFDPAFAERLRSAFDEREIVVMATTAAQVNYWARLVQALGIPPAGFLE